MDNRYSIVYRALQTMDSGWVEEHRFHDTRRWRFDFALPRLHLAIEVQGGIWTLGRHSRGGKAQLAEMEKMNMAVLFGWSVLYFSPQQIHSGEALAFVKQVYDQRNVP